MNNIDTVIGWTAIDAQTDDSWRIRLRQDEIDGFRFALDVACRSGKSYLELRREDFPLPPASIGALSRAVRIAEGRWGFSLTSGFPVNDWSEDQTRLAFWCVGLYLGVARPQNVASDYLTDVRAEGGDYHSKGGRGYNTNSELDFHTDFGDVVGLLCRRTARQGGESMLVSSVTVYQAIANKFPELIPVLQEPFYFSWQGAMGAEDRPFYRCSVAGFKNGYFALRFNKKNVLAAQRDFPEVPRLTAIQQTAIDCLEAEFVNPENRFAMRLEEGDLQLVNNYHVIHSRTAFEDSGDVDRKRHLLRLWLGVPGCQPLPEAWKEPFKATHSNAVRGGLRGRGISKDFLAYEARQARRLGMDNTYYQQQPR